MRSIGKTGPQGDADPDEGRWTIPEFRSYPAGPFGCRPDVAVLVPSPAIPISLSHRGMADSLGGRHRPASRAAQMSCQTSSTAAIDAASDNANAKPNPITSCAMTFTISPLKSGTLRPLSESFCAGDG
jgi:hypothetical protein